MAKKSGITAKQREARKKNMAIARAARKKAKGTKKGIPGMRGTAKLPKGMWTNRKTGTRLYGANIYSP